MCATAQTKILKDYFKIILTFLKAIYLDKVDSEDGALYSTICGRSTALRDKSL